MKGRRMRGGHLATIFGIFIGLAALVFGNASTAEAACVGTDVNANVAVDTTWTVAGSPYCITLAGFNVLEPATLTIQAGVTVKVTSTISVYGALVVTGTSGNRVTFDEINAGNKWGFLQFRRNNCVESHKTSSLGYADFNNMQSYIYLSQQSLSFDNVTINLSTTNRYGLSAYNNNGAACPGSMPQLSFSNSTVNFTTSSNSAVSPAAFLLIDGTNTSITNTSITDIFSGGASNVYAIYYDRSNTSAYTTVTSGNTLAVSVTNDATLEAHGIYYKDTQASGSFTGNTVTVTGPRTVYGVRTIADTVVRNNTVTVNAAPNAVCAGCDGSGAYGIYSTGNASACSDLIVNNKISMTTADYRSLYGIWFQAGNVTGNRITATHTGSTGTVMGVMQQYYDSCFKGNSLSLSGASGTTLYGYYAGTNNNAANNLVVKNNIFKTTGAATKTGIIKDSFCQATVVNSYNLFHGFTSNYNGVTAGTGEIYGDPLFSDADLHLAAASPAIDAGDPADTYLNEPAPNGGRINMGAWGNTASARTSDTSPPASPSISINGGNASTTSTSVTLALSATDNVGVTGYYVSESSTTPLASAFTAVTSATSFSTSTAFTLSAGSGTKTVYAWFRDAAGNISTVTSDTIDYSVLATIPTLSEWGLIFLVSLMGLYAFRRNALGSTAR